MAAAWRQARTTWLPPGSHVSFCCVRVATRRHAWNDANIDNGVPGVYPGAGCSGWQQAIYQSVVNATIYNPAGASVGPYAFTPKISGDVYGVCSRDAVLGNLANATIHAECNTEFYWPEDVTAFSFCHGGAAVFYSPTTIDFYMVDDTRNWPMVQWHANALSVFTNQACPGAAQPTTV